MRLIPFYLAVLLAGFGVSLWRARDYDRSLVAAAAQLPLILLLVTGLVVLYLRITAPVDQGMNDLAYLLVGVVGAISFLVSFAGGLFGAWFRGAGERP